MRYELKYIISSAQYALLKGRLRPFLQLDSHAGGNGDYFIRSIYFDTPEHDALQEKAAGVQDRRKYRLRFYNGNVEGCRLECKRKLGSRIEKKSVGVTAEMAERALQSRLAPEDCAAGGLSGEFYGLVQSRGFRPVVTVDYLREAYVHPVSNLRITFDKEIAAGPVRGSLTRGRCLSNILPEGEMVLEVKYDSFLPEHISHIVSSVRPVQTAASKYVMCGIQQLEGRIL